jgi:acetyltransferase-like isoleucine patch superfamily enzyme
MKIIFKLIIIIEKIKYYYGRLYIKYITQNLGYIENSDISYPIIIKNPSNLYIYKGVKIGPNCLIGAFKKITIGKNSRISSNCIIETGSLNLRTKNYGEHIGSEILIGENVWIGVGSIILSGVSIGDNSFIAAGSIVTKNIPVNSIFKNNIIKNRDYE